MTSKRHSSTRARKHEWAWGYVGIRTVCGLNRGHFAGNLTDHTVHDLGDVEVVDRCTNCLRMRGGTGTSRKRQEVAAP